MSDVRTATRIALVLIDLQRWIVDMPWAPIGGGAVVDACVRLREGFDASGRHPVVLVRHLRADGADGGADAAANLLVPELRTGPQDRVFSKDALDAFEGTGLDGYLRELGVTGLVLAGLAAAHGVAATATTAVALGYDVVVAHDATAGVSEGDYKAALDRLAGLGVRIEPAARLIP
jgi:nicotinamidase-related amidase